MPSSFTTRNRLTKQATGEGSNVWGNILNSGAFDLIDFAADGVVSLSASSVLTTANGAPDQARARVLKITATATITIPSVEKWYLVRSVGTATITNGSNSVTVYPGEITIVLTDGSSMWKLAPNDFPTPTRNSQAATKLYADQLAFNANAGILPGQGEGIVGFLKTVDGLPGWELPTLSEVTGLVDALAGKESIADRATPAEFRSNSADKHIATNAMWESAEQMVIPYAASVELDLAAFTQGKITLTGPVTFTVDNPLPGQDFTLELVQDATGSRAATWPSAFKFVNKFKTLLGTANTSCFVTGRVITPSLILCSLARDPG